MLEIMKAMLSTALKDNSSLKFAVVTGCLKIAKESIFTETNNFGEFEVYCPWDVMYYLRDLENDIQARPVSYWKNTSDNAIIRSFIDYTGAAIRKKSGYYFE